MGSEAHCCVCLAETGRMVPLESLCGHEVCEDCIDRVHQTQGACPLCRSPFPVYVAEVRMEQNNCSMHVVAPTRDDVTKAVALLCLMGMYWESPLGLYATRVVKARPDVAPRWLEVEGLQWWNERDVQGIRCESPVRMAEETCIGLAGVVSLQAQRAVYPVLADE